jgi:hypothetical protein
MSLLIQVFTAALPFPSCPQTAVCLHLQGRRQKKLMVNVHHQAQNHRLHISKLGQSILEPFFWRTRGEAAQEKEVKGRAMASHSVKGL